MSKPKKSEQQQLGVDIEYTTKELKTEQEEKRLIKKMGELRTPANNEYVGSVVVHYFLDSNAILKQRYEINTMTYINFERDLNENLAALGMNNAVIQLRKYFNPQFSHKSTNKKDKRDDIIKA